ncbi:hypothetical protein BLOT_014880 [Blomia tropicalis]|nr:hypothetical protein BLOT_014880 [Blomia tropicalis]
MVKVHPKYNKRRPKNKIKIGTSTRLAGLVEQILQRKRKRNAKALCNFILNTKISVKRKCAQQFTTIESIDTFSYLIIVDSSMTNRCSLGLLLLLITNVRMNKAHASSHPNVTQN